MFESLEQHLHFSLILFLVLMTLEPYIEPQHHFFLVLFFNFFPLVEGLWVGTPTAPFYFPIYFPCYVQLNQEVVGVKPLLIFSLFYMKLKGCGFEPAQPPYFYFHLNCNYLSVGTEVVGSSPHILTVFSF